VLVLVTNRDDVTADWVVLELRRRGTEFVRFNSEDYPTRARLHLSTNTGCLSTDAWAITAEQVDSVWWRRALAPQLGPGLPEPEARWAAGEALAALEGFWASLDAHWVNPPAANLQADCKPEQLRRAARLGFDVPATLITNDVAAARRFIEQHHRVVCKSIYDARVPAAGGTADGLFYTSPIAAADLADDAAFGPEPYLLQALVDKRYDLRVTVIGDEAFACRIDSQPVAQARIDWRLGELGRMTHSVEVLESSVAERCVALARSYNLRFAAIDLARRPDGGLSFFEINANGQWAWVEQLTGLPLAARLADELLGL
jgi:hypothetical protein